MADPIILEWFFPQIVETQWILPPSQPGAAAAIVSVPGSRAVDIGISLIGDIDPEEALLRYEVTAPIALVPARCRVSMDDAHGQNVVIPILLSGLQIGTATIPAGDLDGDFSFPGLTGPIGPGLLRITAPDIVGLHDLSLTLSGDR